MTRAARRRKRRIRKIQRAIAWTVLIVCEIAAAAVPTIITAAFVLPMVWHERGSLEIGGEWLLLIAVFCLTFRMIHNKVCDRIYEEV